MATFPVAGDLKVSDDGTRFVLTTGMQRNKQRIRIGLLLVQGTYKYDARKGLPWFEGMLEKDQLPLFETTLRNYLRSFEDVVQLRSFTLSRNTKTREASANFSLLMRSGEVLEDSVPFLVEV